MNSIMAYLYTGSNWQSLWPPYPYQPTTQDVRGPWVCGDGSLAGGLDYVYQVGCPTPPFGLGGCVGGATSVPTDTYTPTNTRTPTNTPTNTPTPTPTPVDIDGDGYLNPQQVNHIGPGNTNTSFDNCPTVSNATQTNTDGNFIDDTPPSTQDDLTWIMSDAAGDACDSDDDNDGLNDSNETSGPQNCPSATGHTDPLKADTDGDRYLDRVECELGTDPVSAASKPTAAMCIAHFTGVTNTTDTDGDRVYDYVEYCGYYSNRTNSDSDSDAGLDGAHDGCEVGSINNDDKVTSGDQLLLINEINREPVPSLRLANYDLNKDGAVNSGDQSWLASFISSGYPCP